MSTSSQYYRNASTHPHYHDFPANNQEHLYALAASSWQQDLNHASYTGPSPVPFLHYTQGGAESVSHPSSAPGPQTWPAAYARQESQGWVQPVDDPSFASRSALHYDVAEGSTSVLHSTPDPELLRQYQGQQSTNTRPEIASRNEGNVYPSTARVHELQATNVGTEDVVSCAKSATNYSARHPRPCQTTHPSRLVFKHRMQFKDLRGLEHKRHLRMPIAQGSLRNQVQALLGKVGLIYI
jgi:hypothetical protein